MSNRLPDLNKMQKRALDFAYDLPGCAWFMPPGMGKTRAYLEMIRDTGGKALVLAPKLVCLNTWPAERKKWGFDNLTMKFLSGRHRTLRGLADINLLNFEQIPWLVQELNEAGKSPFKFIVYDELSKMKTVGSKRFGDWEPWISRHDFRLGGTGTPTGAHLKDLFGEMYVCDYGKSLGTDYDRFERRYFSYDEYTRKLEPYSDAEDEILDKISSRAISFDINDLDMPPIKHIPISMELPESVRDYYEQMHSENLIEDLDISAVNAAVRQGKLRQLASGGIIDDHRERQYLHSAKAERLKEIVDELQGQPVMIFFEFLSDYESLCRIFKRKIPALYGRTTAKRGSQIIRDWNDGKLPIIALHPRSAGYGLNLQDSGNIIVWYTVPWSYELVNQGVARLWRQGQRNKVLVYYLIVEDTVDREVFDRVGEREDLHNRIMEKLL